MKKILLTTLCLCLLCTGCADPGPSAAAVPTVSVETVVLKATAEDGTLLLERSYPRFTVECPDRQLSQKIEADLQSRIDKWMSASTELADFATEAYNAEKPWTPWFSKLEGHTARLDGAIFSLYFEYSEFAGGNHPNVATDSVTYDCKTGQVLKLADILTDGFVPSDLLSAVNNALASQADVLYDDYEALVGKAFSDSNIKWFLSEEGLCFHFAPYAIGPYSAGVITATIAYSDLSKVLRQEYIPSIP